ncbi:MAG: uncharacterized protein A8A55_3188, partial [Amphiamblys sp. WSBS2006]
PQNSIGCNFNEVVFTDTVLANILPKLDFCFVESLHVTAEKNGHIAPILAQDQTISAGGIQKIELRDCAVTVLLKLEVQEGSVLEELVLAGWTKEHVAPILAQEQNTCIERIQKIELISCAVAVLPKLEVQESSVLEELILAPTHMENIAEILSVEDESINVWDVKVVIHGRHRREVRKN